MMRRLMVLVMVVLLITAMLVASVTPALAAALRRQVACNMEAEEHPLTR